MTALCYLCSSDGRHAVVLIVEPGDREVVRPFVCADCKDDMRKQREREEREG